MKFILTSLLVLIGFAIFEVKFALGKSSESESSEQRHHHRRHHMFERIIKERLAAITPKSPISFKGATAKVLNVTYTGCSGIVSWTHHIHTHIFSKPICSCLKSAVVSGLKCKQPILSLQNVKIPISIAPFSFHVNNFGYDVIVNVHFSATLVRAVPYKIKGARLNLVDIKICP